MDTRIGYPNEHLAGNSDVEISSPLYATAVGLVMNSISNNSQSAYKIELKEFKEQVKQEQPIQVIEEKPIVVDLIEEKKILEDQESTGDKIKRSFFDKYVDKIKDFLDNAE
jgi:cell division protein FtsA